ncbi:MAG: phosphatidate cytidylyltransferase [Burkholderiales bacterium]|nr:phosphatidate cytidylyltransferase [Burkholderiales bacterium]
MLLFAAPRVLWLGACALLMALAAWEWGRFARLPAASNALFALGLVCVVAALVLAPQVQPQLRHVHAAATIFWLFVAPCLILRRAAMGRGLVLATGVAALVPAFSALIELREAAAALTLAVAAVAWISDSAAYFAGRRFGRRKLAPAVSAGKTWEGVWGALAGVTAYAAVWTQFPQAALPPGRLAEAPFLLAAALALALLGIGGDLLESRMKRNAGIKDSGALLPGHGGLLDRVDALLPVLPAAAWLFAR